MDPPDLTMLEIFEILLLHVLSKDACQFAINLFPVSWGSFENIHWLYFLLKMQIWNGCNELNIVGNTYKRYQCKSFISEFRMKSCGMGPQDLTLGENFEILLLHVLSNDACQFTINLFPISWGPFVNMFIYYIFYWKCIFEMGVMCLTL